MDVMNEIFSIIDEDLEDSSEFLNLFSKNLKYAIFTYNEILETGQEWETHDIILLSLFKKLLDQSDGIFILLDHHSYSSCVVSLRATLETYFSISYIFSHKEKYLEKRTLSYGFFVLLEELKVLENNYYSKLAKDADKKQRHTDLKKRIKLSLKKQPFKDIETYYSNYKKRLKSNNRQVYLKWYSLYTHNDAEIFSVNKWIDQIDATLDMKKLYSLLSLDTHGLNALGSLNLINNTVTPLDIRRPQDERMYKVLRSCITHATALMINRFIPNSLEHYKDFLKNRGILPTG